MHSIKQGQTGATPVILIIEKSVRRHK